MRGIQASLRGCAVLPFLLAALVGCPIPPGPVVLITSTTLLDFGAAEDELTFEVTRTETESNMPPLTASSAEPWIRIDPCGSVEENCTSAGPDDPIALRVRVDRSLMVPGDNVGFLRVGAHGLVSKLVEVRAFTALVADFAASDRVPFEGVSVAFTDQSLALPGWTITGQTWDFNDGSLLSSGRRVDHAYGVAGHYTVTLAVTATDGNEEVTTIARREDFITVSARVNPMAGFTASTTAPFVGNPVWFEDSSVPGTAPIHSWEWDFGDGASSREQDPVHRFEPGSAYTVSLKVTSAHGFDIEEREGYIEVTVVPPVADFRIDRADAPVGTVRLFSDLSGPGTAGITSWLWNFGDGGISTQQHPIHVYTERGVFDVTLSVTTAHGEDTVTRAGFASAHLIPPTALFVTSTLRSFTGDLVQFTDRSDFGTASPDSVEYLWGFGDGGTSTEQNPIYAYPGSGTYDVSLAITTEHGDDELVKEGHISVFERNALDEYVRLDDGAYTYDHDPDDTLIGNGYTGHVLRLISQTWRSHNVYAVGENSPEDLDKWSHWLTVIEPDNVTRSSAMLFIAGGSVDEIEPPAAASPELIDLAKATGSVIAVLEQVPNQPVRFPGDETERQDHELIAYTFARFLEEYAIAFPEGGTPDETFEGVTWPLLFPMVKSVVRGMDTVQRFLGDRDTDPVVIRNFIVSGISKRGWAAWLAGAVDNRVTGIAPFVFDFLNQAPQVAHHLALYGDITDPLSAYAEPVLDENNVDWSFFSNLDTPGGLALLALVDPYAYRERYLHTPKLIINATGDELFPPDSSRFYFAELPGEKKLAFLRGAGHDLSTRFDEAVEKLAPWYAARLAGKALPQFEWTAEGDNRIVVTPSALPSRAERWLATSFQRDFREDPELNAFSVTWSAQDVIGPDVNGQYVTSVFSSSIYWTAFYVELTYNSGFQMDGRPVPFSFSTAVQVTPDTFP